MHHPWHELTPGTHVLDDRPRRDCDSGREPQRRVARSVGERPGSLRRVIECGARHPNAAQGSAVSVQ